MLLETVGDYEFARDVKALKDEVRNLSEEIASLRHAVEEKSEKEKKKKEEKSGQDDVVRQLKYDLLMACRLMDGHGGCFGDYPVLMDLLSRGYFPKASKETFIIEYISDMYAGLV